MNAGIITKSEILDTISENIKKAKDLYIFRKENQKDTKIVEDNIEKLLFMENYIENIVDINDEIEDRNESLNQLNNI